MIFGELIRRLKENAAESQRCAPWAKHPSNANVVEGPYARSLVGHKLADITKPREVLRTIHSFDPFIGYAVHIVDPDGEPLVEVDINHAYR